MIKNIVLGSGGHNLIRMIGCMQTLLSVKYIKQEEIENIYATSAGAIIGVYILSLIHISEPTRQP